MQKLESNLVDKDNLNILKKYFSSNRFIDFQINSTKFVRPVKWNNLSFSRNEINKPLPAPVYSFSRSEVSSEANCKCCHKSNTQLLIVEAGNIRADNNIIDNITRKVIYAQGDSVLGWSCSYSVVCRFLWVTKSYLASFRFFRVFRVC